MTAVENGVRTAETSAQPPRPSSAAAVNDPSWSAVINSVRSRWVSSSGRVVRANPDDLRSEQSRWAREHTQPRTEHERTTLVDSTVETIEITDGDMSPRSCIWGSSSGFRAGRTEVVTVPLRSSSGASAGVAASGVEQ